MVLNDTAIKEDKEEQRLMKTRQRLMKTRQRLMKTRQRLMKRESGRKKNKKKEEHRPTVLLCSVSKVGNLS